MSDIKWPLLLGPLTNIKVDKNIKVDVLSVKNNAVIRLGEVDYVKEIDPLKLVAFVNIYSIKW